MFSFTLPEVNFVDANNILSMLGLSGNENKSDIRKKYLQLSRNIILIVVLNLIKKILLQLLMPIN